MTEVESIEEVTPTKVTVWITSNGYHLTCSEEPGVVYVYATHTPKMFYDAIRRILEG